MGVWPKGCLVMEGDWEGGLKASIGGREGEKALEICALNSPTTLTIFLNVFFNFWSGATDCSSAF